MPRRGPPHHLKRIAAPYNWLLSKMGGIYAPHPSAGPHKARECLPLVIILRNRLKYAITRRTDTNFPVGFMDVISIKDTNESFRLLYDAKGHFVLHRIDNKEASYKLCRVKRAIGGARPYLVTSDGRTIRFPDPSLKKGDTVKIDLTTNKISKILPFEMGMLAMVTKGQNIGRIGTLIGRERHLGGFDIIHLKDASGEEFGTRATNVFILGSKKNPEVSLPKRTVQTQPL